MLFLYLISLLSFPCNQIGGKFPICPVRAKALKYWAVYKAFALQGVLLIAIMPPARPGIRRWWIPGGEGNTGYAPGSLNVAARSRGAHNA